jgi:surface carbohydrate biosynthesis protein
MFKSVSKILKLILLGKFTLAEPSNKKILIWDNNLTSCILRYVKKKDTTILYLRDYINLNILLKNFFKLKFTTLDYFNSYIEKVDPKVLVTFTDNAEIFYQLKKSNRRIKIFIQSSWRSADHGIFKKYQKKIKIKNFHVDHMLVFNQYIGQKYSSFIKGSYKSIGSFRSNLVPIKKRSAKYDIVYISTYRENPYTKKVNKKYNVNSIQGQLVKYLLNYSKKNKRKFYIYGKSSPIKERAFYEKFLGNKGWTYIAKENVISEQNWILQTYTFIDQCKLVVSVDSTLAYEAIQRNIKTIFFDIKSSNNDLKSRKFGWPLKLKREGIFWTSKLSQKSCDQKLHKILNMKDNNWKLISKIYAKKLIPRDENNSTFVELLKENKII